MFCIKGQLLVHEWAHLRWGIFDEYPLGYNSQAPSFYVDHTGMVSNHNIT